MKSLSTNREQTASFTIVTLMLAIAPLWLMLAAASTSAQTSHDVSSSTTTASTPSETVLGVGNVGNLQLKWKSVLTEIGFGTELSSPVVANGVVYVGSLAADFYAVNASTGAKLFCCAESSNGGPAAVADGVVYISTTDSVLALNASTGAWLWDFATGAYIDSSPVVANGVVYFGASDGNEYALNASTGAKLWSSTIGGSNAGVFSPAVANGVVYAGSGTGNFYALNASTGAKLWSYNTLIPLDSAPVVANGVVYVGSGDSLYALNANTGAKLWSFAAGGAVESSPAVANGAVYVGCGEGLCALNAGTGAQLWRFSVADGFAPNSSPAVANGVVYITCGGCALALNANTGAELWSYSVPPDMDTFTATNLSGVSVVDGTVYVSAATFHTQGAADDTEDIVYAFSVGADLFLRVQPSTTTVHPGDLLTYAFPVWNLGPTDADFEVLNTQVPAGTTFDYIRISGTPGLGTCTHTPYLGAGPIPIVCHENSSMAPNTTWTVRLTVKVTAPAGTVITESAATMADTTDPNMANNTATVSLSVVP